MDILISKGKAVAYASLDSGQIIQVKRFSASRVLLVHFLRMDSHANRALLRRIHLLKQLPNVVNVPQEHFLTLKVL
jgi:hypothetical protein